MPPKRGRKQAEGEGGKKQGGKRKGAYKMPPPLPAGETLTDLKKKQWVIGESVGKGGFGEIYLAACQGSSASKAAANYVIKIEPHENGPLFCELSFYCRVAKAELIDPWKRENKLKYLPVPYFISSGSHTRGAVRYRFMVMQRFGEDVEKKFCSCDRVFGMKTVCHLALRLLEALEFLHESEYVHADVKGSNLLTGHGKGNEHEVYLVDYGLAYRYCPEGKHKAYKEDPRRAHDGTIEFTSIDAHNGVSPSRRGDMEILGYCLLQWACGRLPWEDNLQNKDYVAKQKKKYKSDVNGLLKACFKDGSPPSCLKEFMRCVFSLGYEDKPDYSRLKDLFQREMTSRAWKDDGKGLDWMQPKKKSVVESGPRKSSPRKRRQPVQTSDDEPSPVKKRGVRKKRVVLSPELGAQEKEEEEKEEEEKEEEEKEEEELVPAQVKRRGRKRVIKDTIEEEEEEEKEEEEKVVRRRKGGRQAQEDSDDEFIPARTRRRRRKGEQELEEEPVRRKMARRKRRGESPVAYQDPSDDDLTPVKKKRVDTPMPARGRGRRRIQRDSPDCPEPGDDVRPTASKAKKGNQKKPARGGKEEGEGEGKGEGKEGEVLPVVLYPSELGYSNGDDTVKCKPTSRPKLKQRQPRRKPQLQDECYIIDDSD